VSANPEMSQIEVRIYRSYWQDGLLDLFAGATVLLIGLGWVLGFVFASVVVPPVAIVLWPLVRARVTEPRLGRVRFNSERMLDLRMGAMALVTVGILVGGAVLLKSSLGGPASSVERWFAPAIPACLLAMLALCCAAALHLARLAGHAIAFLACGILVALLRMEPGWAMMCGGAVTAFAGAVMFGTFLRRFPRLQDNLSE
jgi:hypothetical protein